MAEQQNSGIEILRQTIERIKGGKHQGVTAISQYTLKEALEVEQKVLKWAEKHNYDLVGDPHQKIENAEHIQRIHIYRHYLQPRIEELQLAENINKIIIQPENTPEQPTFL